MTLRIGKSVDTATSCDCLSASLFVPDVGSDDSNSNILLDAQNPMFANATPISWTTPSHAFTTGTGSQIPFPHSANKESASNSGSKGGGSNSNSGGAGSGGMPSKPSGLGGWASVAGHDEIQRVATADRKDLDRHAERYAAGGSISATDRRGSFADGQRLMQWCDALTVPLAAHLHPSYWKQRGGELQGACIFVLFLSLHTHVKCSLEAHIW